MGITVTGWLMIRNEEYWIGHNLLPALQVLDHVIVADTGSADDTLEIVREVAAPFADKFTLLTYQPLSHDLNGQKPRNDMAKTTTTEWGLLIDGDEWYPPEYLEQIKATDMPAGVNLGYVPLHVVRWDDMMHKFRFAEEWSGQVLYRVAGLRWIGPYPDEGPNYNFDGSKSYYLPGNASGRHVLDFHHLTRSRLDAQTPHRMGKRGLTPMRETIEMPFDLRRWPNPYAGLVR